MTFEEVWEQVKDLPEAAVRQIPQSLKQDTKKRLSELKPEEVSRIVLAAIDEINHGSIIRLDELVRKRLRG